MQRRLFTLGKQLLAQQDVDRVLTAALDGVIDLCGAERGMILLFGEDREVIFEQARQLDRQDIENPKFEISRSLIERVRTEGRGFWSVNVLDDPGVGHRQSVQRLGILSVICQPLRRQEEIFGLMYLDNRSAEGVFDQEAAELVAMFSDFISLAAHNALERRRLNERIAGLTERLKGREGFDRIVGQDPALLRALDMVARVASSEATVLIRGESGTGKELIARALHHQSHRREGPFVAVNCGALPENLLESELFGHVRGSFTGAVRDNPGWFGRARGGTLFLDEVVELSPGLQAKLLRVLESGKVAPVGSTRSRPADVRLVAATHQDLETLVRRGEVRQDFLYRINVLEVRVPPLRQRRGDLPLLIRHFLTALAEEHGREEKRLSPTAEALLTAHDWPGNVRELKNALQRAVLLAEGVLLEPRHLPDSLRSGPEAESAEARFKTAKRRVVERFERDYLSRCLEASRGNIRQAARLADLHYKNFYEKMKKYDIDPEELKSP